MRFRKIDPRFWNDEKVRELNDDGKLAFLFLLTHPSMTSLGAMRGTVAGLAAELGWPAKRLERAIAPAITSRMIEVNAAASFIGLPNFLRYNQPESPNVCKAWVAALDLIPECAEKRALIGRCRQHLAGPFLQAFEEAFGKASAEASPHPSSNPEPEPKQEPEPKPEKAKAPRARAAARRAQEPADPAFEELCRIYPRQEAIAGALKPWREAVKTTPGDEILAGARRLLPSLEQKYREEPKYVPLLKNWIRDQRWKDEPPAVALQGRNGANGHRSRVDEINASGERAKAKLRAIYADREPDTLTTPLVMVDAERS